MLNRLLPKQFLLHPTNPRYFSKIAKDPYKILGLEPTASPSEIKGRFAKLAQKHHPDKNPDPLSKEIFSEINEAYQVLNNRKKKREFDMSSKNERAYEEPYDFTGKSEFTGFAYDDYDQEWEMGGDSNHFESVFRDINDFFKFPESTYKQEKPIKGKDIAMNIDINFAEAVNGCRKEITFWKKDVCSTCEGTKSKPGTVPIKCNPCESTGTLNFNEDGVNIQMQCRFCVGKGYVIKEHCGVCGGSGIEMRVHCEVIEIPRGTKNGYLFKLFGRGNKGDFGGKRGDVVIQFNVIKDSSYKVDGLDLHVECDVGLVDSVLGGKTCVSTLAGDIDIPIERGTVKGDFHVLNGLGLRNELQSDEFGDLYIWFKVRIPESVSKEQANVLKKIQMVEVSLEGEE